MSSDSSGTETLSKYALRGGSASFSSTAYDAEVVVSKPWAEVHLLSPPSACPDLNLTLTSENGESLEKTTADGEKGASKTTAVRFPEPPDGECYALEVTPGGANDSQCHLDGLEAGEVTNEQARPDDRSDATRMGAYAPVTFQLSPEGRAEPKNEEADEAPLVFGSEEAEPADQPLTPNSESAEAFTDGWIYVFRAETTEEDAQVYVSEIYVDGQGRYAHANFDGNPEAGTDEVVWLPVDGEPGRSIQHWFWHSEERLPQARAEQMRRELQPRVEAGVGETFYLPRLSFSREADRWALSTPQYAERSEDEECWQVYLPSPHALIETALEPYETAVRDLLTWQERIAPVKHLHGLVEQLRGADHDTFADDIRAPLKGEHQENPPADAAEEWGQKHFVKHQTMMAECERAARRLVRLLRHPALKARQIDRTWLAQQTDRTAPKKEAADLYGAAVRFLPVTDAGQKYLESVFKDSRLKGALAPYRREDTGEGIPVEERPTVSSHSTDVASRTTPADLAVGGDGAPTQLSEIEPPQTGTEQGPRDPEASAGEPIEMSEEQREAQKEVAERVRDKLEKERALEALRPSRFNAIDQFFGPTEKTTQGLFSMIEAFSDTITQWVEREALAPTFATLTVVATETKPVLRTTPYGLEIGRLVQTRRIQIPVLTAERYTYVDQIEIDNWAKKIDDHPVYSKMKTSIRRGLGLASVAMGYAKIERGLAAGGARGHTQVVKETAAISQFLFEEIADVTKSAGASRVARTLAKGVRWTGYLAVVADAILGVWAVGERLHAGDYDGAAATAVRATGTVMLGMALTEAAYAGATGGLAAIANASVLGFWIGWFTGFALLALALGYVFVSWWVDTELEIWLQEECMWGGEWKESKISRKALSLVEAEGVPDENEQLVRSVGEQMEAFQQVIYAYSVDFNGSVETLGSSMYQGGDLVWERTQIPVGEGDGVGKDSIPAFVVRIDREMPDLPIPEGARLLITAEIERNGLPQWQRAWHVRPGRPPEAKGLLLPGRTPPEKPEHFDPSTSDSLVLRIFDEKHRAALQKAESDYKSQPVGVAVEGLWKMLEPLGEYLIRTKVMLSPSGKTDEERYFEEEETLSLTRTEDAYGNRRLEYSLQQ